jgi:ABC-type multidrug transport system fused ATPase/permease subunit
VAIARALIKEPFLLIFDDATSAMDAYSREQAQQALDRAMEGRTSIIIADKLSTIRNCELVFVMNEGQVVETGTYEELEEDPRSYFNKLKAGMDE